MALWNSTGNQLVERRNSFLRDVAAHGFTLVYRIQQSSGGVYDPGTDAMISGVVVPVNTVYEKSALVLPIKALDNDNSGSRLVVAGGHRLGGIDIAQSLVCRLRVSVPLNFSAVYIIAGQSYKLDRVLSSATVGAQPFWNDVLLTVA